MVAILDLCQKTNSAGLDFSRLLVCYSRNPSGLKTIEKPSVAICGGSFSILTGLKWPMRCVTLSVLRERTHYIDECVIPIYGHDFM